MSQLRELRQTYHVGLGLAVVLALEATSRSFICRGAKVGRECLGGHCVENRWDAGETGRRLRPSRKTLERQELELR